MGSRILIRAGRPPHRPVRLEAAHAYRNVGTIATNSGNLLFQDAVYRTLRTPGTELVVDSLSTERRGVDQAHIDRINAEFDLLVLPLANSFREDFLTPLGRLTDVVEKLSIPVVVTGVGGQVGVEGDPTHAGGEIDAATTRFVRAILERSESIGVRGEFTKAYLEHLGFPADRIDVIGCPSLHVFEPGTQVPSPSGTLAPDARLAVNLTPSVPWMRTFLERNLAAYPNLTYLPQDNDTLGLLLWGEEFDAPAGFPGSLDHELCRDDKIRFFTEPIPWQRFLATQDFACGSRFHGNVAALLAGIPAFQLAHDSRTVELARFHQIPYQEYPIEAHVPAEELDASALYEQCDLTAFNAAREPNRDLWFAFLDRNGLPHGDVPDPEYSAELARADYPAAARPLTEADPRMLAERLRWLHQGTRGDELRCGGAYAPEFAPALGHVRDVQTRFTELRERMNLQSTTIKEQRTRISELTRTVDKQSRQLAMLIARTAPLHTRIARRLRRLFGAASPSA